jgi:predicted nucleic acid-binding protein
LIVVDASAVLEVLLRKPRAWLVEERMFAEGASLHVPHLLDLEVTQALRRHTLDGSLTAKRGLEALERLSDLILTRYSHHEFLQRVWSLRHNVSAYDAVYLALAEALDAPLLTTDARLAAAAASHSRVILI